MCEQSPILGAGREDISVYRNPQANPGKIFAGWSTSANGTVLPTGTTVTKNLYLYAIWEQGCAVTLDANGGHFTLEDGTQTPLLWQR